MKFKPDILPPTQIIERCLGLNPNSDLVLAAKSQDLRRVDMLQKMSQDGADDTLALLFNSLYANFHFGPDVMKAFAEPSQLYVDSSGQKLQFKPSEKS